MRPLVLIAVGLLLAASIADAQDEGDWRFSLSGAYISGPVDGYVQTPSGGEPGTSSSKRPKLDEVGISDTSIYDVSGIAAYHNEEFYAGAQIIRMSGSDTLSETLISQDQTFPAGTHVNSDIDLDWYRFGYRHRFQLGDDWTLWPGIGAAVWDFHYRLRGGDVTADRSYIKVNVQFGLETEWRPHGGPFSIDLVLLATPPISPPLPEIYTEELVAKYHLLDRAHIDLDVFAGVAFEQIYYEDNQTLPNRIRAEFGPMLIVGGTLRF